MAQQLFPNFVSEAPRISENTFKVHCAIDFGTDGVALAYAFGEANKVTAHAEWSYKKYAPKFKPKTIVLLDEHCQAIGFGKDAKHTYMAADTMKDKWMLFERFKMALYEDDTPGNCNSVDDEKQVEIKDTLTATNGKTVKASIVFVAVFKHLHKQARSYLKRNKLSRNLFKTLTDKDWQWIITVPAIWNDASKYKMRQWAIDAGLVDPNIEGQCKIVYEPDCASLALQYDINKNKSRICSAARVNTSYHNITTFQKGNKYVLIDAGGGTVDIACHEILGEFGVKEVLAPSGGPWGSTYIDDQFEALLKEMFGTHWMTEFKEEHANVYTALLHNFQVAKEEFYGQGEHNVRIPFDFINFMEDKVDEKEGSEQIDMDIEVFVSSRTAFGKSNLLSLSDQYLKIKRKAWERMFNHVVDPIVNHIHKLLAEPKLMRNCKYLCLVGGFSSSVYFQNKMEKAFGSRSKYRMRMIIPNRPILSVVEGAAYFGITPNYIKARVLKYTYGHRVDLPKDTAISAGVPSHYIDNNLHYNDYHKAQYVKDCFEIFASKNEEIHTGQIVSKSCKRRNPKDPTSELDIIVTGMECPKIASQGKKLGSISIDWDNETDMGITNEFHFYDTLIHVVLYPSKQPEKKQTRYITNYQ